jgi:hypothetical protein
MSKRLFVHTLSFPEHIWADFLRTFFGQSTLMVDEDGDDIPNRFYFDEDEEPGRRGFDILFEHDLESANPNVLPCVVIEDLGVSALGISLNKLKTWTVFRTTSKTRADLLRSTYVFHCCSRNRGESRMLASIVSNALIVFNDQLLRAGLHKIEPWNIGKTVPLKIGADETYVDTPVQVTFEFQQTWKTVEDGNAFFKGFSLVVPPDELIGYVRLVMNLSDPSLMRYLGTSMAVQDPNLAVYVGSSIDVLDPAVTESYARTSMDLEDPTFTGRYLRTSMRIA